MFSINFMYDWSGRKFCSKSTCELGKLQFIEHFDILPIDINWLHMLV